MQHINSSYKIANASILEYPIVRDDSVHVSVYTVSQKYCQGNQCQRHIIKHQEIILFNNVDEVVAGLISQENELQLVENETELTEIIKYERYNEQKKVLYMTILS